MGGWVGWLNTDNRAISVQLNLTGTATGTELGNKEIQVFFKNKRNSLAGVTDPYVVKTLPWNARGSFTRLFLQILTHLCIPMWSFLFTHRPNSTVIYFITRNTASGFDTKHYFLFEVSFVVTVRGRICYLE